MSDATKTDLQEGISIPAGIVRAAMACQAKSDVRYYLEGFYVNATGQVVGTNGHVLFKTSVSLDTHIKTNYIIKMESKAPVSATNVRFTWLKEESGIAECTNANGKILKTIGFKIIDGRFPDFERVIPSGDKEPTDSIGLMPKYMAKAAECFGNDTPCEIQLRGDNNPVVIKPQNPEKAKFNWADDTVLVVMPCRL